MAEFLHNSPFGSFTLGFIFLTMSSFKMFDLNLKSRNVNILKMKIDFKNLKNGNLKQDRFFWQFNI